MIPTLTYFSNSDFLILYLDPTIICRHVNIQIITLQSLRSSNLSKYQFLLQLQSHMRRAIFSQRQPPTTLATFQLFTPELSLSCLLIFIYLKGTATETDIQ